jgi:hypothetical protein
MKTHLLLLLCILSGCATQQESGTVYNSAPTRGRMQFNITHHLPAKCVGLKFTFVEDLQVDPYMPHLFDPSIYKAYLHLVSYRLQQYGLVEADKFIHADYLLCLSFGPNEDKTSTHITISLNQIDLGKSRTTAVYSAEGTAWVDIGFSEQAQIHMLDSILTTFPGPVDRHWDEAFRPHPFSR